MHMERALAQRAHAPRLFFKPVTIRVGTLFAADLLGFLLAAIVSYVVHMAVELTPVSRAVEQIVNQGFTWHGWGSVLVIATIVAYLASKGRYTARVPVWTELRSLVLAAVIGLLWDSFIRVVGYGIFPRFETVCRWVVLVPCLLFTRWCARSVLNYLGLWRMRTVIVGVERSTAPVRAALQSDSRLGYQVVGFFNVRGTPMTRQPGWGRRVMAQKNAEFAVVAMGDDDTEDLARVAEDLSRERVPFAMVPAFGGLPVTDVSSHYFLSHDVMMLVYGNNLARPISQFVKMVFDQAVALVALLLLSPLLVGLAFLVKLDGGPALFGHRRIGENGRHFDCLKFRSMVTDADVVLRRVLTTDPAARAEWEATHKLRDDPRVTAIGRVLRKTSLDELPQLLNVLRGDMSLVGPRPIVDAEVAKYGEDISFYYETRPGITGLWQVSGRSNTTYEYRVRLDVWYVRNWSLWHDLAILLKTIPAVLAKDGAV